jgi:uncharacterized protein YggE
MTITLSRRSFVILVVAAAAMVAAYLLGAARPSVANAAPAATTVLAASSSPTTTGGITVTGTGTVKGTPDTLTVSLSTTATGSTIDAALAEATKAQNAVIAALKKNGVADKDLQTSNFSIQPNYTNKGLPSGYVVAEGVSAKIHGLAKAGGRLNSAVQAGGDNVRVDGVYVNIDDTDPLKGGARTAAVADAKQRAEQYAQASGRELGQVQSISEQTSYTPTPYAYDRVSATASGAAAAVPVQAGAQDVSVTVTVVYAFA